MAGLCGELNSDVWKETELNCLGTVLKNSGRRLEVDLMRIDIKKTTVESWLKW